MQELLIDWRRIESNDHECDGNERTWSLMVERGWVGHLLLSLLPTITYHHRHRHHHCGVEWREIICANRMCHQSQTDRQTDELDITSSTSTRVVRNERPICEDDDDVDAIVKI